MTATPIPRTLALTAYGDMDVSRLHGRPPGRKPVETRVLPAERLDEVVEHLRKAIARGARAYWVCPLVEESEKIDLAAAEERAAELQQALGPAVGLVHGKMKPAERDGAMEKFKSGEIACWSPPRSSKWASMCRRRPSWWWNMPSASAWRSCTSCAGASGAAPANRAACWSISRRWARPPRRGCKTLRDTDDGFVIAEEDLRLRGPGELLGTRQSGAARIPHGRSGGAWRTAGGGARRRQARPVARSGSEIAARRSLRILLYLFGRDEAVRYLRAG